MKRILTACIGAVILLASCWSETSTVTITTPDGKTVTTQTTDTSTTSTPKKHDTAQCIQGCAILGMEQKVSCTKLCEAGEAMDKAEAWDTAACEKLEGIYQHTCYTNSAQKLNNPDTCGKINNDLYKDSCYSEVAKSLNKPELCESMSKDAMIKPLCYSEIAKATKNKSVCEKIKSTLFYDSCLKDAE